VIHTDDYYLNVVYNIANSPEIFIFQKPADTIKPGEKVEIVRYIVNRAAIKRKGQLILRKLPMCINSLISKITCGRY